LKTTSAIYSSLKYYLPVITSSCYSAVKATSLDMNAYSCIRTSDQTGFSWNETVGIHVTAISRNCLHIFKSTVL